MTVQRELIVGERVRTPEEDGRVEYEGSGTVVVALFCGKTWVFDRHEVCTRDELLPEERWPELDTPGSGC